MKFVSWIIASHNTRMEQRPYGPKPETACKGIYGRVLVPGNPPYMAMDMTGIGVREM